MKKLQLYIYTHFCPDYTSGLAFSIAENEIEAKQLIEENLGHPVYEWGDLEIRNIKEKVGRGVYGGG
jgi:hypothetical protein